ncbi:MAG: FAD-dependent oxidoreductase [Actinomycetota bacterium]
MHFLSSFDAMSEFDVAVVGAGVSGLVAARRLAGAGHNVVVLEARPQVGGRTQLKEVHGLVIDRGGQFLGHTMTHLLALLQEVGIETKPNESMRVADRQDVWYRNGVRSLYRGELPPLPEETANALLVAIGQLQVMADAVSVDEPWTSPDATALDAMTLETWLSQNVTDEDVKVILTALFSLALVGAPAQTSLLYALWFIASSGGVAALGADVDMTIRGGAGSLALKLARDLGARVRCDWPVHRIDHGDDGARITGTHGHAVTARHLVIAMSPADVRHIRFDPALPTARQALHATWAQHSVVKFHAFYETPFWRADNLSGAALSDEPGAPIVFDGSPEDGSRGILLGFLATHGPRLFGGNEPDLLDDLPRLRNHIAQTLGRYFGEKAAAPVDVLIHNWTIEPYITGIGAATPPGLLSAFGQAIRRPVGVIHWAGTETANTWSGWISGAVEAGERAAQEIPRVLSD